MYTFSLMLQLCNRIQDAPLSKNFSIREAVRAVLFDAEGKVPLLFSTRHNYHKLPGGGVEAGESYQQALEREVLEEIGAIIKDVSELGMVEEFRVRFNLQQISYCYIGQVSKKGENKLEPDELAEGFEVVWVPLVEAIARLESDTPHDYEGPFIKERELVFLRTAARRYE